MVLTKLKLFDILQEVTELEEIRLQRIKESDLYDDEGNKKCPGSMDARCIVASSMEDRSNIFCKETCDIPFDSVDDENSDLKGLISHNEIFDTPVAIDVNTPSLGRQGDHAGLVEGVSSEKAGFPTNTPSLETAEEIYDASVADVNYTRLTERIRPSRKTSFSFEANFNGNITEDSRLDGTSRAVYDDTEKSDSQSQGILPSNLNHYPNIFALDDDSDDSIEEEWPFAFQQEDLTQVAKRTKRKSNCDSSIQPFTSISRDRHHDVSLVSSGPGTNVARTKIRNTSSDNIHQPALTEKDNFKQKLKKFKFKKVSLP